MSKEEIGIEDLDPESEVIDSGVEDSDGDDNDACDEPEDGDEATEGSDESRDDGESEDDDDEDDDDEDDDEDEDDDDDEDEPEDDEDDEDEPGASVKTKRVKLDLIDPVYNKSWLISLLAGLIGALLGFILISLFTYSAKTVFFPFFVIAPLIAYLFNSLLKGGRDIRSLISIAVFSLVFAYSTELATRASLYAQSNDMSVFQIPALVAQAFGRSGAFAASLSTNTYPVVFTALGVFITWELLRAGRVAKITPEIQDDESDEDDESDSDTESDECTDVDTDNGIDESFESGEDIEADDESGEDTEDQ